MKTIFYSWQSDLPSEINREFIEKSMEIAISRLNDEFSIYNSPRNSEKEYMLDKDIKDTPGSPPIVDTIFKKIDTSSIFIADLTFVGETKENPDTKKVKLLPNPNVLIEYGYAFKIKGHKRIIAVMNTIYGKPSHETMPFNLRHLNFPVTYALSENDKADKHTEMQESLAKSLYESIALIVKNEPTSQGTIEVTVVKDKSKFYILEELKKILILPCLKINNKDEAAVSMSVDELEFQISDSWLAANKSNFHGGMIRTKRGSVSRHPSEFVDMHKDIRIDAYGSEVITVAFEMNIKPYLEQFQNREPIKIRGIVKSLDGREANFEDEIDSY